MKRFLVFVLATVMLLSMCACTWGGTKKPTDEQPPATDTTDPNVNNTTNGAPDIVAGGSLVVGTNVDVNTAASWRIRSNQEKLILSGIYEPLIRFNNDGEMVPYLAESVVADEAALTYTVTLREGVTFSDGSPLDADALLWNFENFKENSQTSATHFGSVESFKKVDNKTVVIHLTGWNTQIPYSLNSVAGLMYSKKAFDEHGYDWCLENPVGTGPLMLTESVTDSHKVMKKNENYWNKAVSDIKFDTVTFRIIADEMSAQAAVISGEINAYMGGSFAFKNTMANMGYNITENKMWYTIYFLIFGSDVEGSPLRDVRVRQAIAYAIDSDTIAQTIDYGKTFVSNQYAVEGTPFYSDEVKGYGYDVEKARALLKDAGYPNGFSTTLSVGVDQALDRYMIAIQGYLKEVGIEIKLDYQETAIWTSKGIYETEEGMILAGHGFGANLVNQAVNNFSKRAVSGVGMLKNSKLHPDDLDKALMSALGASNTEDMLSNMHTAEKLIIDEYCLGYPVVMASAQSLTSATDIVDDYGYGGYNEFANWCQIYRVKK